MKFYYKDIALYDTHQIKHAGKKYWGHGKIIDVLQIISTVSGLLRRIEWNAQVAKLQWVTKDLLGFVYSNLKIGCNCFTENSDANIKHKQLLTIKVYHKGFSGCMTYS